MQLLKKWTGAVLALSVLTCTFAGCSSGKEVDASGTSSSVTSGASSGEPGQMAEGYSNGLTADGKFEGITALDYVTLPDYRSMKAPESVTDISDEDLQAELDSLTAQYATSEQVTDRAVKDGDTVNIDYVGSVDGVEFEGGNTQGNGTTVTIGVTSYIDDFLEQLIGHLPGDTFDVNVTFPEPYENNPDLSGKDAVFVTTINYIQESVTPELTDDFVKEHWEESDGWTTVSQMEEGVRAQLSREAAVEYLWEQLGEQAEVSQVPDALVKYHEATLRAYYAALAAQYNMELEDFLTAYVGVDSMDTLVAQNQSMLEENARASLLAQALAEDMNYQVTDEMLGDFMKNQMGFEDYSAIESAYGKPYLLLLAREELIKEDLVPKE